MLVEIQMMKSILMWFWTEMRSMLLDIEEKVILAIKRQRPWLNCGYVPVFCGRFSLVQFSRSVMFDSLQPQELPHTRLPCPYQLPEFIQTHVHWIGDAIQPSHPLSSLSPPALNLSQHQGLFQSVNFLHQVAKVLEFQLQHQSFQWIFRTDFL